MSQILTISNDLRTIDIPRDFVLGVESDDDVNRVYFSLPAMYGDTALWPYKIRINYLNANGEGDMYTVPDEDKEIEADGIVDSIPIIDAVEEVIEFTDVRYVSSYDQDMVHLYYHEPDELDTESNSIWFDISSDTIYMYRTAYGDQQWHNIEEKYVYDTTTGEWTGYPAAEASRLKTILRLLANNWSSNENSTISYSENMFLFVAKTEAAANSFLAQTGSAPYFLFAEYSKNSTLVTKLYQYVPEVDGTAREWIEITDESTFGVPKNESGVPIYGDNYHIRFSWLVGRHACEIKGKVRFIVCLKLTDDQGVITNEFNTAVHEVPVLEGLETSEAIVQEREDIIEAILLRMDKIESIDIEGGYDKVIEVLDSIPEDYSELSQDVSDLKDDLNINYNRITDGVFAPLLEVGNIRYADSDISFTDSTYRVRTKEGVYYSLKAGDVIGLTSYNNAHFMAFYRTGNTWVSSGWKTVDYTVPVSGEYAILLAKTTEDTSEVLPSPEAIGFSVLITDNNSVHAELDDLATILHVVDVVPNAFTLRGGRLYNQCGQFPEGGILRITSVPNDTRIAVNGYSDNSYATKITDSGWIMSAPKDIDVNKDLYYQVMIVNYDYSAITDISIADDFSMQHEYDLQGKVDAINGSIEKKFVAYEKIQSETVKSIAHRGDFVTAPQCTKPAYILARKNGFRYAENDVNITSDNNYVMWHDTTLERLGNLVDISGYEIYTDGNTFYYYDSENSKLYTYTSEYVESSVSVSSLTRCNGANYNTASLTLDVLKRIDFGIYKGEAYKGTTILTFAEWILLCKQLGMEAYIDTKISYTPERVADLTTAVRQLGMLDNATWININTTTIADYIRAIDSKARMCTLNHPTAELIETFTPYNTGRGFFFNGNAKTITQNDVLLGLNAGFEVEAYYVEYANQTEAKTLERIAEFVNMGVTGLTLDAYRVEDAFASMLI